MPRGSTQRSLGRRLVTLEVDSGARGRGASDSVEPSGPTSRRASSSLCPASRSEAGSAWVPHPARLGDTPKPPGRTTSTAVASAAIWTIIGLAASHVPYQRDARGYSGDGEGRVGQVAPDRGRAVTAGRLAGADSQQKPGLAQSVLRPARHADTLVLA